MIEEEIVGYRTIQHIAKYLSIKTKTLYAMVGSGKIPHYRIGRLIRFKKEEIDTWMEGNKACNQERDVPAMSLKTKSTKSRGSSMDIERIIRKTIAQVKGEKYTSSCGKSDQIKGLGKEDDHGNL